MAEKVTIETLHQMKREGRKIAVGVCYEAQMAQILERAGADILSVGDSLSRAFLANPPGDFLTVDEMAVFCRAVSRAAKRAVVNCDMPGKAVAAGPKIGVESAKRLMGEAGAEMIKIDTRDDMDGLFPVVQAAIKAGIPTYPQIGFDALGPLHSGDDIRDDIVRRCQILEQEGAVAIDLTAVTSDIYGAASKAVKIPVLGGQATAEADGKIYVSYAAVGYRAEALDRDGPSAAKFILETMKSNFDNVKAGKY